MTKWVNVDGLIVKFGSDEGDTVKGGYVQPYDDKHVLEFVIDYTDALSATYSILGSASGTTDGSIGPVVPKGARIIGLETLVETAFTSSGTIGSSTLGLGLKQLADLSTEIDHDGFLTASFVGSKLDAAGERNFQEVGTTGSGALIGTTTSANGVIALANTAHGSHPYTAGKLRVRLYFYFP